MGQKIIQEHRIYHSDWIIELASNIPGHPFSTIPIVQNQELLNNLKQKVTTQKTQNMNCATGIPPHVLQCVELRRLLELSTTILKKVSEQNELIRSSIFDAIEHHAMSNGNITRSHLQQILDSFKTDLKEDVRAQLQELRDNGFGRSTNMPAENREMTNNNPPQTTTYKYYWYDERAWHVPEGFVFPEDTKREVGFKLWMMGMPNYHSRNVEGNTEHSPVPPFRLLKPTFLPPEVSKKFKLHWRPLFLMMEEAFELDRNAQITAENVNEYYKAGDKHLRENWFSYVYNNKKYNPDNWKISTWSKYIGRSYIEKHGSDSDRQNLPQRSRYNRPHQGRKRRVQPKQNIRTRRRTNPRQRRGRGLNQDEQHVEDDAFAAAFQKLLYRQRPFNGI